MITIYTCPKGFVEKHTVIIQRNAFAALKALQIPKQVLVFGNDPGVAEVSAEFGFQHIPEMETNEFGTPRIDDMFAKADRLAKFSMLCYVNSDIILRDDFAQGIRDLTKVIGNRDYLAIGRRWNLNLDEQLPPGEELDRRLKKSQRGSFTALDYFIYRRGFVSNMPPFAIGRCGWDNWLALQPIERGVPLIDLSDEVRCYHQNHDYCQPNGKGGILRNAEEILTGPENIRNLELSGLTNMRCTLHDATYRLTNGRLKRRITGTWRRQCDRFKEWSMETLPRKVLIRPWSFILNRILIFGWRMIYRESFF